MRTEGSIFLFVLSIMGLIITICLIYWQSMHYFFDISIYRARYYQQYYLTYSLLTYGVAYTKEKMSENKLGEESSFSKKEIFNEWPPSNVMYSAVLTIALKNIHEVEVQAELFEKNTVVSSMKCKVIEKLSGEIFMQEFSYV
jgi:hypothetical protein